MPYAAVSSDLIIRFILTHPVSPLCSLHLKLLLYRDLCTLSNYLLLFYVMFSLSIAQYYYIERQLNSVVQNSQTKVVCLGGVRTSGPLYPITL